MGRVRQINLSFFKVIEEDYYTLEERWQPVMVVYLWEGLGDVPMYNVIEIGNRIHVK